MTVSASQRPPQRSELEHMPGVFPHAAGFDIGSTEVVVALPPDRPAPTVRAFSTFTTDLKQVMAWVLAHRLDTVAMASTGIDWMPMYDMREDAGIRVSLGNARHFQIVPGRKTDDNDAQWRPKLHALGWLHASFRPDEAMGVLRGLLRHRAQLVEHRSPHILPMQKALKRMHIQRPEVLAEVTGVTGLAILRAMVAGERRGQVWAKLRRPACKKTEEDMVKALPGTWRDEPLFVRQPSLALYAYSTAKMAECDTRIAQQFSAMKPRFEGEGDPPAPPKSRTKQGSQSKHKPSSNGRAHVWRLLGVDLVEVSGISASIAPTVSSEIGTDRSRFPTVKPFCSWRGLAPHHDISGGRIRRSHVMNVHHRAGQAFRQAAQSGARSQSIFGACFRAIRGKRGAETAVVATAHKMARVVYHMLKSREAFTPESSQALDQNRRQRELHKLQRRAKALGDKLEPALL